MLNETQMPDQNSQMKSNNLLSQDQTIDDEHTVLLDNQIDNSGGSFAGLDVTGDATIIVAPKTKIKGNYGIGLEDDNKPTNVTIADQT